MLYGVFGLAPAKNFAGGLDRARFGRRGAAEGPGKGSRQWG